MNDKRKTKAQLIAELEALRQQAQGGSERLVRILRAIRNVNQLITREKDPGRLLQGACDCLVETRGYYGAWIALLDPAGRVTTAAAAGEGAIARLDFLKNSGLPACGRRTLTQLEMAVIQPDAAACADCPLLNILSDTYSDRMVIAMRLAHAGQVYGGLGVTVPRQIAIDAEEQGLFTEVAGDIAFALHSIELENKHRQAEERLRASETRYRELFDNINSGVAVYEVKDNGQDFVFKDFNRAGERLDNDQRERLIGQSIFAARPGVERFGLIDVFRRVWQTGQPEHYPVTLYQDERLTGWYENYVYKLPAGEIVAVFENVTARKQAEMEIKQLAKFPSENPNPVLRVTSEGVVIYANHASLALLESWQCAVGQALPIQWRELAQDVLQAGQSAQAEAAVDGRIFSLTFAPIGEAGYVNVYGLDVTERKQLEETLRVSLVKYQTLFEAFPLGITIADKAGNILESNKEAGRLLGLSPEAQAQRKIDGIEWRIVRLDGSPMPPDEYASVRALRENRLIENVEMGIVKGPGQVTWINVTAAPIPLEGYGVAIAYGDITARVQAETQYQTLFREMLDGFALHEIILDAQGQPVDYRFLAVNPAFERLTGLQAKNLIGRTVLEVMPNTEPYWIETYGQVALTGAPAHFENYSGEIGRYYEVTAFRPTPGQFACIFADVTERKRAEIKLRESEAKFRTLFEEMGEGVTLTHQGIMVDANPCMARLLGVADPQQLVGRSLLDYMSPASRELALAEIKKIQTGQIQKTVAEFSYCRPDGAVVWVEMHGSKFEMGGKIYGLSVHHDITARKRAEELVKASLREKETLLKEIHHRVKNNMQVIVSIASLQADMERNPQMLDALRAIQNRVKAMAYVHERLYETPDLARVDFAEYVYKLATHLFRVYGAGGVALETDIENVHLGIDQAVPCGLIINELVSNSLKYAFPPSPPAPLPTGEGSRIRIQMRAAASQVTLTVSDNGIGLPPDLDWRNTESLGMQLTAILAQQLQGTLELAPQARGAAFTLTFRVE